MIVNYGILIYPKEPRKKHLLIVYPSGYLNHWKLRTWRSLEDFCWGPPVFWKGLSSIEIPYKVCVRNLLCNWHQCCWSSLFGLVSYSAPYGCHTDVTQMSYGCHTDVILTFSNWLMELIDAYGNAYGNNLRWWVPPGCTLASDPPLRMPWPPPGETHTFEVWFYEDALVEGVEGRFQLECCGCENINSETVWFIKFITDSWFDSWVMVLLFWSSMIPPWFHILFHWSGDHHGPGMTWDDLPGPSTTEHLRQKGQGSQVGTSAQKGHP